MTGDARADGEPDGVPGKAADPSTGSGADAVDGSPADAVDGSPADPTPCTYTEYVEGPPVEDLPATGEDATGVEARVWDALYGVEDPEMPISVVDLGLVYGVTVADGHATVEMTLTYTGCPAREMLTRDVEAAAAGVEGVESAAVRLVWSPAWSVELVTEAGREQLREFGLSV